MSHSVTCGDFASEPDDDDAEWVVAGFASAAAAQEYARRFIRAQIEDLRGEVDDETTLKSTYLAFGEYALTPGFDAAAWVEHCILNPAERRADTDYEALDPSA
jgi:hypothetical protein